MPINYKIIIYASHNQYRIMENMLPFLIEGNLNVCKMAIYVFSIHDWIYVSEGIMRSFLALQQLLLFILIVVFINYLRNICEKLMNLPKKYFELGSLL